MLNNLLSLNTDLENDSIAYEGSHRRDGREIFNMDWLDSLEFKEEHGADAEESGYPEKDSERKRKHNQGERERMCTNQLATLLTMLRAALLVGRVKMDYWHRSGLAPALASQAGELSASKEWPRWLLHIKPLEYKILLYTVWCV